MDLRVDMDKLLQLRKEYLEEVVRREAGDRDLEAEVGTVGGRDTRETEEDTLGTKRTGDTSG